MKVLTPGVFVHRNCVNARYPFSRFQRFTLEADQVPWTRTLANYCPPDYTSEGIHGKPWADPDIHNLIASWNAEDGLLSRKSYNGLYYLDGEGRPLNIIGRTGIRGRGVLGRWGPNHAADPLVTRWKQDSNSDKKVLQIILIQRRDTGMWALPGGMVDPGEKYSATLKREFLEEALAKSKDSALIDKFFKQGTEIYKGYVDDHRNTDNAWMETVACNFHDETGDIVKQFGLEAGDDARNVAQIEMSKITSEALKKNIADMLAGRKERKFVESVELQIGLRDYDPEKDKRFNGSIRLPNVPAPNRKVGLIGTAVHCDQAKKVGVGCIDAEGAKKFNKDKKLIKKWAKPFDVLIASESLMKQIPKLMGNTLNKIGKFPVALGENEKVEDKVKEIKSTVRFQLKKVLCMGTAVGTVALSEEELRQNINMSINFLVSLLKKGWQNIRTLHIKTSMGKPVRIYG